MEKTYKEISAIYNRLQDDESRYIFEKRMMYSISGDRKFITEMVQNTSREYPWVKAFFKKIKKMEKAGKKLIIDGSGKYGRILLDIFPEINWKMFSDKEPQEDGICGIPVVNREVAVNNNQNAMFVVSSIKYCDEIEAELRSLGVKDIINFGKLVLDNAEPLTQKDDINKYQYFDVFNFSAEEVFIDCGCYDCKTIEHFLNATNGKYKEIISFEAENEAYKRCLEIVTKKGWNNIEIYNNAIWDKKEKLAFFQKEFGASGIKSKKGGESKNVDLLEEISAITLDDALQKKKPTYIKMDIEGAELEALNGAKSIIKKYKPKFGLSIYHNSADIFNLPTKLLEIEPNYRFWLRHYTLSDVDTVLYAEV